MILRRLRLGYYAANGLYQLRSMLGSRLCSPRSVASMNMSAFGQACRWEDEISRSLPKKAVRGVVETEGFSQRVDAAVRLFFHHVKFLCQNRNVDVVVCVIPDDLYDVVSKRVTAPPEERIEDPEPNDLVEANFAER